VAEIQEGTAPGVVWAVGCQAQEGEASLGDAFLVHPSGDRVLIAVIDGLGHGREANHAARAVLTALADAAERELVEVVRHCHRQAQRTRGACVSVASLAGGTLEWVGVGNVEAALLRADRGAVRPVESMMLSGGVVGYQLPPLRPRTVDVVPGDLLVMATDGLRADFASSIIRTDVPRMVASRVMRTQRSANDDDAMVLVARLGGDGG
jgi:phosphoserine phosphatase RsbX